MRQTALALILVTLASAGCASGPFSRGPATSMPPPMTAVPRTDQLIAHLNQNAQGVQSVQYTDVRVQAKQGLKSFGVNAMLHYQKPKNFRLVAEALSSTQADIGSNENEFWFWFKQDNQPLYRCSYEDLPRVRNLQLPIHPDWVAEGLCLQELGRADEYQMRQVGQTLELTSQATSPQGQPMQKVTVVAMSGPNTGKIIRHQLRSLQGQEVWSAEIREYHNPQRAGGHVVPRKVTLRSSAEKMEIDFTLEGPRVNMLQVGRAGDLFAVPRGYQVIDLARGPAGAPSSLQRVRGE